MDGSCRENHYLVMLCSGSTGMRTALGEHYSVVAFPVTRKSDFGEQNGRIVFPRAAKNTIGEQKHRVLFPNFFITSLTTQAVK